MTTQLILISTCLSILLTSYAYAKSTCNIMSFQRHTLPSALKGRTSDNGNILITEIPPIRCATVTFTTSTTRNRVSHLMENHFEATFVNNTVGTSQSISFDKNALKAGYIRIGPNIPAEAYVCFGPAVTPIANISCDVQ